MSQTKLKKFQVSFTVKGEYSTELEAHSASEALESAWCEMQVIRAGDVAYDIGNEIVNEVTDETD